MSAVLRAAFGYCFLVFVVRIVGRRPGKQLTPFEFVIIFFLGGLTLTFMVGDDRSLTNAFVQITAVGLTYYVVMFLRQRYPKFARYTDGTPLVLMDKGKWLPKTMAYMGIADDDVMAAARDKNILTLEQIEYAILERNGEISVIQKETEDSEK